MCGFFCFFLVCHIYTSARTYNYILVLVANILNVFEDLNSLETVTQLSTYIFIAYTGIIPLKSSHSTSAFTFLKFYV